MDVVNHFLQIGPLFRRHLTGRITHIFIGAALNNFHPEADFFEKLFKVGELENHPYTASNCAGICIDLLSCGGDIITSRSSYSTHGNHHRFLLHCATYFTVKLLRGTYTAAGRLNPHHHSFHRTVVPKLGQLFYGWLGVGDNSLNLYDSNLFTKHRTCITAT